MLSPNWSICKDKGKSDYKNYSHTTHIRMYGSCMGLILLHPCQIQIQFSDSLPCAKKQLVLNVELLLAEVVLIPVISISSYLQFKIQSQRCYTQQNVRAVNAQSLMHTACNQPKEFTSVGGQRVKDTKTFLLKKSNLLIQAQIRVRKLPAVGYELHNRGQERIHLIPILPSRAQYSQLYVILGIFLSFSIRSRTRH